MIYYEDKRFNFWELFNEGNGTLIRSDIVGTKDNPYMRSFPELIDVGIMGHCEAGAKGVCKAAGVDCYQCGPTANRPNMGLDDYKRIIDEAKGKTFQIALGGAGDPNKHELFHEILEYTRDKGIVPNLTTSGIDISDKEMKLISQYCGAAAVSFYSKIISGKESNEQTVEAIKKLSSVITTNVHYVVSKSSIEEAIYRLENDFWPSEISAVIFLLYKPVGLGEKSKIIENDDKLLRFMKAALNKKHRYRIGFDTCFTPILVDFETYLDMKSVDSCEAGRFSMYIDADMNAYPCSFDNQAGKFKISLREYSIQEVWESDLFHHFRKKGTGCKGCSSYKACNGGCALELGINAGALCDS